MLRIIILLMKFIYMLRIQMKQNINILLNHKNKHHKDLKAFIEFQYEFPKQARVSINRM